MLQVIGQWREQEAGAVVPVEEHEVETERWGGGSCRERRRECFTAVSLHFCTTHQNSAACTPQPGGRALARFVLSLGPLPSHIFLLLSRATVVI